MDRKKRIMFFMGDLQGGGAEKILINTLKFLSPEKYDLTLILLKDNGLLLKNVPNNVKHIFLTHHDKPNEIRIFYRFFKYLPTRFLYKFYIKEKYDVEIAFLEGLATHIIGCSPNKKSKKIAWVHIDMMKNRWSDVDFKSNKQQKDVYQRFDKIICVSNYCKNKFVDRFGITNNVNVIYNIFDNKNILKMSYDKCSSLVNKKKFTLLSSGRFTSQKGFDRLLIVFKRIIKEGIDCDLWLLGDGLMCQELKDYVSTNNLNNNVQFLGFQDNPYPYMRKADIFVCSSRSEGYSSVVAESLILKIPVITTDVSGADELLENGKYGLIVDNSEEGLFNGLKLLLTNKNLYMDYKKRADERSMMFDAEERIKKVEKMLDEC